MISSVTRQTAWTSSAVGVKLPTTDSVLEVVEVEVEVEMEVVEEVEVWWTAVPPCGTGSCAGPRPRPTVWWSSPARPTSPSSTNTVSKQPGEEIRNFPFTPGGGRRSIGNNSHFYLER